MDKYEYRLKTDQMKKLADKKDTFSAIKVADTIDWRKVRDVKTLTSAAEVYVANGRYDTAECTVPDHEAQSPEILRSSSWHPENSPLLWQFPSADT